MVATSANILSSLGIKGASVEGGSGKSGFVPVLGADGKIDVSVIPSERLSDELVIPPLPHVAYVSVSASSEAEPDGSIASPFRTIGSAAGSGASCIILAPGAYSETSVHFSSEATTVSIACDGSATISGDLVLSCPAAGTRIVLENINVAGTIMASSSLVLELSGTSSAAGIDGSVSVDDPLGHFISEVRLGPGTSISLDSISNVGEIVQVSNTDLILNLSAEAGTTVTEALDRLRGTVVSSASFSAKPDGTGISESAEDVERVQGESEDIYDISSSLSTIVDAVNSTFYRKGSSVELSAAVVEGNVSSGSVSADAISTDSMSIGDSSITLDEDGYFISE